MALPAPLSADDRLAIADLATTYARAVDRRTFGLLDEVFTVDGVLDTGRGVRTGLDEIVAAMQGLHRYEVTRHVLGQQLVEVTADRPRRARAETYCDAHHLVVDGDRRVDWRMHLRYVDEVVRTDAGWRIARRTLHTDWTDQREVDPGTPPR